jgi:hypothetical protein
MRWVAGVLCAVLFAGCGVLDDEAPALSQGPDPNVYGPREAVPREPPEIPIPRLHSPSEDVARSLEAGEIGVVGMTGVIGVRPDVLDTANDVRIDSLTWSRWGADGAVGEGEMLARECQPTCASGRTKTVPATVTLSGVRECRGRRYFEGASVRVESGEQPANYVRAPC